MFVSAGNSIVSDTDGPATNEELGDGMLHRPSPTGPACEGMLKPVVCLLVRDLCLAAAWF